MRFTIADVVSQFKREWTSYLAPESIKAVCQEIGLTWRERKLDPATSFQLILLQALHGNVAISALRHLAEMRFSGAAFYKARLRLPLEVFEKLTERIAASIEQPDMSQGKRLGHRVLIADGTGISMPENPLLVEVFGHPRKREDKTGFPVARLVFLMHFGTGMIAKVLINPFRSNEGRECYRLHSELKPGDIFLGDRAFCSYAHICALIRLKAHALFRLHQKVTADFTPGRKHAPPNELGEWDEWSNDRQVHWKNLQWPGHQGASRWLKDLNHTLRQEPARYQIDHDWQGFEWIEYKDWQQSIMFSISFCTRHRRGCLR